jgi:hypothetical protein
MMGDTYPLRRAFQYAIVGVLAISLLSAGVMAGTPLSATQNRNVSLAQGNQPQTGFFGSGITMTIHTEVGRDGTIQSYKIQMNMSQTLFAQYRSNVKSGGYATIEDQFVSMWTANGTESFEHDYNKERRGNLVTVTFSFQNHNPPTNIAVGLSKQNGTAFYSDRRFVSSASVSASAEWNGYALNYYLTMPGEIMSTNANSTHGNTAEWHFTGGEIGQTPILATSKIPKKSGGGGMLIPGALIVGGLVVLVGIAFAFRRRDRF